MRNKDKPWFDDQCRHAFGLKQEAHLQWTRDRSRVNWKEYIRRQVRVNETYSEVQRQLSDRKRDVLMNLQPHISNGPLLSLRCSAQVRHCLLLLVRVVYRCVGRLVRLICCRIILTASSPGELLVRPSPAIRLLGLPPLPSGRERSSLLLDLEACGGTDPLGMFPLFFKKTAAVIVARLSVVFPRLVRLSSFPACWRQANVYPNSERSTVLLCCQLPIDLHNISIV